MEQTAVEKKFGKYVMASMITMFLQSAYSMIDGLFVSNLIGDTALSAVNVAWPVIAVVTAIGTGVGCGGAVMMSTKQGEGKNEESNIVRANVILALLASSIVVTILFLVLLTPLLKLMGAEGELLRLSQIYGRVMLTGGVLQILSCGLTPLLRNDNRAVITAIGVSFFLFIFIIATARFYPAIYGYEGEAAELGYHAVMVTAAQLIFTGLVRVTNSFFYSVGKDKYSLFMIYFDPLIMTPLTIVIFPRILGLDGIWITAVMTQFILNIVAFGMFASHERQMKRMEAEKALAGK